MAAYGIDVDILIVGAGPAGLAAAVAAKEAEPSHLTWVYNPSEWQQAFLLR